MAEGFLFNMIDKLIGKLGKVAIESWNMRDDLKKLDKNMSEIKAVVFDAEEQQSTNNNNHQVQLWLENLKDALDDADDLLDEFNTEKLRRQELRQEVEGKRYLLVLDDIWNEDRDLWLQLMTLLKHGAKGSKIIITTRSEKVAKISGSSSIFFLKGLDEKQSWKLFSQLAFENEKELENENLDSRQVPTSLLSASKLRTFLLLQHWDTGNHYDTSIELSPCNSILPSFKRFRALNLQGAGSIPSCIGRMKHLRYLDLSVTLPVEELPRCITELVNLETLLLNHCFFLKELPKDLWKLVSLRHLELVGCTALTCMPRGIEKMTNLQTLTTFVLDTTSKDSAKASELRGLNNLRGQLEIKGLECLRNSPTEAKHINLMEKPHLDDLSLFWVEPTFGDVNVSDLENDNIILHHIVQHSHIKTLRIYEFGGVAMSSLGNLDELTLYGCTRLQYLELAPLHVKRISMTKLPSLEWIVNDNNNNNSVNSSTFCASLTEIDLDNLPDLKGWCRCSEEEMSKGCRHQFKSLESLNIDVCPDLISIPQHIDIKEIKLKGVTAKILQQAVTHSKVEFLDVKDILNLKSLRGVLQHLTRVSELSIRKCMEFDPCNDDGDASYTMKWKELTNLKVLTFKKIPKMKYLPEGLQHITTLQTLRIIDCVNLTSLPEWVTSLRVLDIKKCPNVTSLPAAVEDQ
ncbi:hypothetical protein P8452_30357 [Trifolium repens]|nr:hypothetical protein P8452_30357 [Trifolium repens]